MMYRPIESDTPPETTTVVGANYVAEYKLVKILEIKPIINADYEEISDEIK